MLAVWMVISLAACNASEEVSVGEDFTETTEQKVPEEGENDLNSDPKDENENEGTGNENEGTEPPAQEVRWIELVQESCQQYTIVSDSPDYDKMAQGFATRMTQITGVSFLAKKSTEKSSVSGNKIQVGKKPSSVMADESRLTYDGILSTELRKTIHVTGHHKDAVERSINRFLEGVATQQPKRDESGSISFAVPETSLLFLENPESYAITSPKLLGVDLSEFVIVIPENINANEHYMARQLIHEVGLRTGVLLKYVTDQKSAKAHEIVLGKTNRGATQTLYSTLERGQYVIRGMGGSVYVACDNYLVMDDARKAIHGLYGNFENTEIHLSAKPDYSSQMVEKPSTDTIRVISTNIIAAADANAVEKYDVDGMTYQLRMGLQGRMILDYLPDFVGMQEMQENGTNGVTAYMHSELLKTVGSEYSYVIYPELRMVENWTPILYRHTVWQIVEQDVLSSATFDNAMHRWQWAVFSRIENPSEMYILLNLHYPTSRYVPQQMAAAALVNEQIKLLREKYPTAPIFVTGDFNARSSSDTFTATVDGTGMITSNPNASAIDHVVYDPLLVEFLGSKSIENGLMHMTSDHRPFMADVVLREST